MRYFKSVFTLAGTNYRVGEKLGNPPIEVSDITVDEDGLNEVTVWVTDEEGKERMKVVIPYHAVELMVKVN